MKENKTLARKATREMFGLDVPGKWTKLYRKIFHPGKKLCDVCGLWVEDVEVPTHYTSRGSMYTHPIHILTSKKGRETIEALSRMSAEEISIRAEGYGARRI